MSEDSIYQAIFKGQTSSDIIVDHWIEFYKADRQKALTSLLQFFFDSSGCKGKVSEICDDYTVLIRTLTSEFNEDTSDYPMCQVGIKWKRFRSGFCDFLVNLIRRCQNCIIYDGYMMANITSLLAGLSDSQVRAFRHTSTLASMKLITVLFEILTTVSSKYSVSKRQYEYETKKSSERRTFGRVELLSSLNKELKENIDILNELITFIFRAVFINRYRDVVPAIREICIFEMGMWMKKAPDMVLDDLHLKYIGWSLSDKVGGVRLKAIQTLIPLYETGKHVAKLELFTLKFKDRIVSMTRDVENIVAVEAINLIQVIIQNFDYAFSEDDTDEIFKLMYSSASDVARKAGELFCVKLESKVKSIAFSEQNSQTLPNLNVLFIKHLMKFHVEHAMHEHTSYLVDSLIENSVAIKDWKCMTNLLLDLYQNVESLTSNEEKLLIEMMVYSIGQASTRIPPIGRQSKKIQTLKMLKQVKDDAQNISMHFIGVLSCLLEKFSADSEMLSTLLEIPQYFDLTILAFYPSFIENLESLLLKIPNIVNVYHDANILGKCSKILEIFCNKNYRISLKAEICKNMIIDHNVNKYKSLMNNWSQAVNELDNDLKFSFTDCLLKISVFYSVFDLGNWCLWDDLFNFLNEVIKARITIPEDCVKHCIVSCYLSLFWDLKHYEDNFTNTTECRMELKFKSRFLPFIDILKRFIAHSVSKTCSEESYIIFCDLLIILKNCFKNLGLPSLPIGNTQKILQNFVEERVFRENEIIEFESSIEHLYKKRVMLSSYCKLFMFGIFPVYFISHVIKHYVTSFCDFGDILKTTILGTKNIDNVDFARAIISALIMVFEESANELVIEENKYSLRNLMDIKELAKQLSPFIMTTEDKDAIAIYTLHTEGISFALRNNVAHQEGKLLTSYHLLFFEILLEFSHKLSHHNKVNILNFLTNKLSLDIKLDSCQHQPLLSYKNILNTRKNS